MPLGDVQEVLISPQNLQSDLAICIEGYHIREGRHSSTASMNESDYLLAGVHRHSKVHPYKLFIGVHEIEVTHGLAVVMHGSDPSSPMAKCHRNGKASIFLPEDDGGGC